MPTRDTKSEFVYVLYIATTPKKLWTALTNSEYTRKYFFGMRVTSDWTLGSTIEYRTPDGGLDVHGEILECEPGQRLSFSFKHPLDPRWRKQPSRVAFGIKQMGEMVKLTVRHDHLIPEDWEDSTNTFRGLNNGWPVILSSLKSVLETGTPLPAKL